MKIPVPHILVNLTQFNLEVVHMQLKDVTHEQSLIQPPFRANCMNWVIGHMLSNRGGLLELLGLPPILSEAEEKTYGYGSEPITGPQGASDLGDMLRRLDESQAQIAAALGKLSEDDLAGEVEIWRGKVALAEALYFTVWHETYHTGQLEPLRQLAGKNDKVV